MSSKTWTTYYNNPKWSVTKGEMSEYGKVKVSGTFEESEHMQVGVTDEATIAMPFTATKPSDVERYHLSNTVSFPIATASFTDAQDQQGKQPEEGSLHD